MKVHMTVGVVTAALSFVISSGGLSAAPPAKAIIVKQPNCPVEIIGYSARFQRSITSSTTEGITHSLEYRNRGKQKVTAIRFSLVSFDVFNRFLDTVGGISMDDLELEKSRKSSWVSRPYSDFSFLTGLAYVDLVRLEDGTIWQSDDATILEEIRKVEKDFDAKSLKEKEKPVR